ncbi:MAG: NAD(P)-binding protein [Hungatella sp.]|nr:NAD(P)-binding protein [Hungatella sp.]
METKYLIIGGGITGLSFAAGLEEDYYILEKEKVAGGYCRTIKEKGFVWDYAGHFFHFNDDIIKKRFKRLLNSDEIIYNRKNTKIYYKGQYIDYPFQYNIHQLYKEEFIDCLVGLFESQEHEESENFEDMLYKRYGEAICDKFLIPYNEKLYACNLNILDIDAMGRFFPSSRPEEIVKGFRRKQQKTYNDEFLYPKQGAEAFVDAVCQEINQERLLTETEVLEIDVEKQEVCTSRGIFKYEYLINTMPLNKFLERANIEHSINFSYNQVLVFNMGFDSVPNDIACHWIYYPDKEICFYRVGFYNNILHSDRMSLYVELGFPKGKKIDIDLWIERVLCDLKKVGIITDQHLIASNNLVMRPAYVHITSESQKRIEQLTDKLSKKNVFSIGRYGAWRYCSIEDCIQQADGLRNRIMEK